MRASAVVLLVLALVACAGAQPVVAPPALTDLEKLTLVNAVQKFEIAQLRALAVQRELQALLKSLEKPGYTFDLQTMTYIKAAGPPSK
jgi:hypothetical protein